MSAFKGEVRTLYCFYYQEEESERGWMMDIDQHYAVYEDCTECNGYGRRYIIDQEGGRHILPCGSCAVKFVAKIVEHCDLGPDFEQDMLEDFVREHTRIIKIAESE